MNKHSKIYIAGHNGMVGSAIHQQLLQLEYENIIFANRNELDLRNQADVQLFFKEQKPDFVFLAAAKVGGIQANNTYRAEFIYDNLMITNNIIHSAYLSKVSKLLFLGSSCIYPKFANQPMSEEELLKGELEPTNEPYAIAKIAGLKMCEAYNDQYGCNFISVMPTNLYGPNDNYDLQNSHVLPALIRKFHEAKINQLKEVEIWGDGSPRREFLHVQDLAEACVFLMNNYNDKKIVNIGLGEDISIKELALLVKEIVGFNGELNFDTSKPNGTPKKLLNVDRLNSLGFRAKIQLKDGIKTVYDEFVANYSNIISHA